MKYLSYLLTRAVVQLVAWLPFDVLYRISDAMAWLFFKWGYRKSVVMDNLVRCFPEKSEAERLEIARKSYQNLTDITLEAIKGMTIPLDELHVRYRYAQSEEVNQFLRMGKSVVLTGGHFGNWEWAVITIAHQFVGNTVGVYKPLNNKYLDNYFFKTRDRDGKMILKSMKETFASVVQYKKEPTVFILVADQSPSNRKTAQWVKFFGQDTACLPGVDVISRKNDFAVVYYHIERVSRGHYIMSFETLEGQATATFEGEITQKMMSKLEEKIRQRPEMWLWSHRRWKMKRTEH